MAAQGSRRGASRSASSTRPSAAGLATEPCRPRNDRRSALTVRGAPIDVGERHAVREVGAEGVARQQGAGLGVDLGDHVHGGGVAH